MVVSIMAPYWIKHRWRLALAASAGSLLIVMFFAARPSSHRTKAVERQPNGQQTDRPEAAPTASPQLDKFPETPGALGGDTEDAPTAHDVEQWLTSADQKLRNQAIEIFFPALAARDPVTAASIVDAIENAELRSTLLRVLARHWAEREPSESLAWAQTLTNSEERDTAVTEVFSRIAESDPEAAVRLRHWYSNEHAVDSELENLAQRWAEQDFPAALQWADSLVHDEQRQLVVARAAFVQAQRSPAEATELVMSRIPEGPAQSEVLISVLHHWSNRIDGEKNSLLQHAPNSTTPPRPSHTWDNTIRAGTVPI